MAEIPDYRCQKRVGLLTFLKSYMKLSTKIRTIYQSDGELYLEYHRGTYTSQAFIKKMNRWFEIRLRELECLYSLQSMTAGTAYPAAVFVKSFCQSVLKNQLHDIIPPLLSKKSIKIIGTKHLCLSKAASCSDNRS